MLPGHRSKFLLAAALAAALAAGCSTGVDVGQDGSDSRSAAADAAGDASLRGVCPATIVVQSSWYPQVEHAALYQLLGAGARTDTGRKAVSGPLLARGLNTG